MRIYAHLLRNMCKVLFAPCHLSLGAPPPQGLRHGQTQINLLFKIGGFAFHQNQPSWIAPVWVEDWPGS